MADIQEYKCPSCGGAISFDSSLQKMKCPYCDSEFDVETLKTYDAQLESLSKDDEMRWETPGKVWQEGESEGMRIYVCNSCGGQIIGDENLAATKCPYCSNPVVLMGQVAGDLKPDYIIPFKKDKEAAKATLLKHYSKKAFLPDSFKDQNHIEEIKRLYVPFWLFDGDAKGSAVFNATRVHSWTDPKFHYTRTEHYSLIREGNMKFNKVPVDGSSKMPDDLMESIEPYDFSQAVDFQTAYMAGYMADRYDVDADSSVARANERIRATTEDAFRDSGGGGYTTVDLRESNIGVKNGKASYAMYPVWLLNTTWQGDRYTFAMNGQNGKFVGDLPIDKGKLWGKRALIFAVSAVVSAVAEVLAFLFSYTNSYGSGDFFGYVPWMGVIIAALVIGIIISLAVTSAQKKKHFSVKPMRGAEYATEGINITRSQDIFLYSNVVMVPIDNGNKRGPGGGGRPG